jgi:hypothetical protein
VDLKGRDTWHGAGLADTFALGLLLRGERSGNPVYYANTITIQGQQVFVGDAPAEDVVMHSVYLPVVLRGN